MKRIQFHLTEPQIETLQAMQVETGLPVAEHVRRAVDLYINSEEIAAELKQIKERLLSLENFMREWRLSNEAGK